MSTPVATPAVTTPGRLRLACMDADAPPLFGLASVPGGRAGFEPAVAALLADELGLNLEWAIMSWGEMLPAVQRHDVDAVLCGQGIIPSRQEQVDFTAPYGVWEVNELQRVYDAEHLDALFAGWSVTQRAICVQTANDTWERVEGEPPASTWADGTRGVVLVRATPDK